MKKLIITTFIFFSLIPGLCLAQAAEASSQDLSDAFNSVQKDVGDRAGYQTSGNVSLETMISKIIKTFLSFLGIIFMILLILGGFNWMTAGGQETKVQKASKTIKQAIIGLIIVLGSYAISYFIIKAFSFLAS